MTLSTTTIGTLYLIPTTLGDDRIDRIIPPYLKELVNEIEHYVVENERSARRYLRKLEIKRPIDELNFYVLDKDTAPSLVSNYVKVLLAGNSVGIISEAGCPGIADPGALLVAAAHERNIQVVPLVGPSSILMALIASGFNGQSFAFHGYLPKERNLRIRKLKDLESAVYRNAQTQIFMETPFRNMHLLEDLLSSCEKDTKLCIASAITTEDEFVKTKTIAQWKSKLPEINKLPTIFLLYK